MSNSITQLQEYIDKIEKNQDYEYEEIKEEKIKKSTIRNALTCTMCEFTCHKGCSHKQDDIANCPIFDE